MSVEAPGRSLHSPQSEALVDQAPGKLVLDLLGISAVAAVLVGMSVVPPLWAGVGLCAGGTVLALRRGRRARHR
ncbi:hypothetical protein G4H71_14370 [Rhodococcus triatomae]|uniref:Uncharacterized protein n=1 Tax=Rhodococcus triatomae TaxID=300028 RepID=A0A1G8NL41_9NOCA|nr:hypothetical protein [Rhodococcus triatomae]QNG20032.1 hypothetical protein G4H72_16005 [Rhodococcus triatomae]QNG24052.1 hypothetical protein G4H71_14370 [Rhodococcus triatomae]SDI80979.1 hypothetical protein SAMN05444695_111102 [Rhodococcus triatomae]